MVTNFKKNHSYNVEDLLNSLQLSSLLKNQVKELYNSFKPRFLELFSDEESSEIAILYILLFMSSDRKAEISAHKKGLILRLLRRSLKNESNKKVYITGLFSNITVLIVNFCEACLLHLFLCFSMLPKDISKQQALLISKSKVDNIDPNNLEVYYESSLKEINEELSQPLIHTLVLTFVLEPIKQSMYYKD